MKVCKCKVIIFIKVSQNMFKNMKKIDIVKIVVVIKFFVFLYCCCFCDNLIIELFKL